MEKTGFKNLVDRLSTIATLDKWEPLYDERMDFFYWKKPRLSKGVQLVKVSRETHMYLTPQGKIEGVLVEYLRDNFTRHNVEYRGMTKLFNKKVNDHEYTIRRRSKKMKTYFDKFTETLRADIYKDAVGNKKSIDELDFIIEQALSQ